MLVPSKKIFYAVEAVLFIAYNSKGEPISSAEIALQQGLPARYLEPLMQKLVRGGILRGVRGPQGGYVLGRERRRITLKDICEVVADEHDLPPVSAVLGQLVLKPEIENLVTRWEEALSKVDVATLCERATAQHVPTTFTNATDFAI